MPIEKIAYRVLVIEDNPGDYALVENLLVENFEKVVITHANDFSSAMKVLSTENCPFEVILLDISLPDKAGEPLIKEVAELCPVAPVIVLTGYSDLKFGVKSLSLGASDYLLKDDLTSTSLYKSIIYSSERKKGITELLESEKRYSEIFDFSPLPMWVINIHTLAFLDVNKAAINHFGYSREELLGMTLREIRPSDDIPALESSIERSRRNPETIAHRVTIHRRKNGDLRKVEIQIAQFKYKGILSNVVIGTDITERLSYIQAIEDRNEKLREISWIQSHVIRAPLSRIMGLIPLIAESINSDNERDLMLSYLTQSANELDLVIKDINKRTIITENDNDPKIGISFEYANTQ